MTRDRALVIVAKAPQPGRTKTRLSPPLSLADAAALYEAFLVDTTQAALALSWERVTLLHPDLPGVAQALSVLVSDAAHLQPQDGVGLGAALSSAFHTHLAAGFDRVVLIASDTPTLPNALIQAASASLDHEDLVIGPSADGGYYLIGMRTFYPALFKGILWSTQYVLEQTLERARALALRVCSLPEWYDVDTVAELYRLAADLEQLPDDVAPQTRARLRSIAAALQLTTSSSGA